MQEAELITLLAYIDHEDVTIDDLKDVLSIELRTENKEKQNEVTFIRIFIRKGKGCITSFLRKIEEGSPKEKAFMQSIERVSDFADKLKVLTGDEEGRLFKIFNPNTNRQTLGKKNDFYLMWLILNKIDIHIVLTYRKEILNDLEGIFKLVKNMPAGKTQADFIEHVKSVIDKYAKYSKTNI